MSVRPVSRRDFLKLASAGTLGFSLSQLRLDRALALYTLMIPVIGSGHDFLGNGLTPEPQTAFPTLAEFITTIKTKDRMVTSKKISGVWSKDVALAATVVSQPVDKPEYVSENQGELTHFSMPDTYGNVLGLLAHNKSKVGSSILNLQPGHKITLITKSGELSKYQVTEVLIYQAHEPSSVYSDFSEIHTPGTKLSASELFHEVYTGDPHVTFQTCEERYGDSTWGRRFILAYPLTL